MDSHHCPFTITPLTTKARSSLAIKHHKCCCTDLPTCSNLECQWLFMSISNMNCLMAASHQGQLVSHLRLSQEGASSLSWHPQVFPRPSPVPGSRGLTEHPQVRWCSSPNLLPLESQWNSTKFSRNEHIGWKYKHNATWCRCCIVSSEFEVTKKWREREKCEDSCYLFPLWIKEEFSFLCQIEL